ncbi:suppressor of fused domain protein [Paenibacillus yanchengensis]|uniref:Suppressor of fused domain protein n=1 Tax=Paenibacillus yanchengensis TaxID=2035833 RepID=A0ABW4YF48_9BACL
MNEEVNAPGWDAIDEAMVKIYGQQEPKHYGTLISYSLGGEDPLDGISVYKSELPMPHWHFVTYGFSELYEKESEDAEYSGYGFELTFKLVRAEDEEEPPAWAINLLQNMGRYVFSSGNVFRAGDYMDANGPICLDADTLLTALAFTHDPNLPEIKTVNGCVEFIQMIGITEHELEAMQVWNTLGVLRVSAEQMLGFVTDLSRDCLLQIPEIAAAVEQGIEQEGSNTGFLYVDQLHWEPGKSGWFKKESDRIQIGAKQAEIISKMLRGRIIKQKSLTLVSQTFRLVFEPGDSARYEVEEQSMMIRLNTAAATELSQKLVPQESEFELTSLPKLTFQIVKTHVRDREDNIVKTIG